MMKKTLPAVLVIIALLIACTGISYKNYVNGLNRVTTVSTAPNQIRYEVTADGILEFARQHTLPLPAGARVQEVFVELGQDFRAGDSLVRLELSSLRLLLYDNLAQQESLSQQAGPSPKASAARLRREQLQAQARQLQEIIDLDGVVTAPCDGQITALQLAGEGLVAAESTQLMYAVPSEGLSFTWFLPPSQYKNYRSATIGLASQSVRIDWTGLYGIYDPARGAYRFSVLLEETEDTAHIASGQYGKITLLYVSQEEYQAVLPKTCIRQSDGANYVYVVKRRDTLHGEERYLQKVGVTILEEDGLNAAIMAPLEDVVDNALRPPKDLEAVLVLEG